MLRKRILIDIGVVLGLVALYITQGWIRQRWSEFVVMRQVIVAIACSNPTEAAKLGIACGSPGAMPVTPAQNATPPAPVAPVNPEKIKSR